MLGPELTALLTKLAGSPGASSQRFGAPRLPTPKAPPVPKLTPPVPPAAMAPQAPLLKSAHEDTAGYEEAGVRFPEEVGLHRIRPNQHARMVNMALTRPRLGLASLLASGMLSQPKTAAVHSVLAFLDELEQA